MHRFLLACSHDGRQVWRVCSVPPVPHPVPRSTYIIQLKPVNASSSTVRLWASCQSRAPGPVVTTWQLHWQKLLLWPKERIQVNGIKFTPHLFMCWIKPITKDTEWGKWEATLTSVSLQSLIPLPEGKNRQRKIILEIFTTVWNQSCSERLLWRIL